eukprot:TRINITY_DN20237_c0_g1_i3.p1 TRINITY_DN20237_c0_g1~~TRINITY_DN20237_c0_g1_i3.p1  ORF type:complete len:267 (-),score=17.00 TRINITY_DN20237_c0_g1_i3:69-869(-)
MELFGAAIGFVAVLLAFAMFKLLGARSAQGTIRSLWSVAKTARPMEQKDALVCVAGVGIEGDRYSLENQTGRYSCNPEPGRNITLISAQILENLSQKGFSIDPANCRRNVVVHGIDLSSPDLLGRELLVGGSVVLFVHRPCAPCMYLEGMLKSKGLYLEIFGNAGLSCEILVGGTIVPGDVVRVSTTPRAPERCHTWSDAKLAHPLRRSPEQKQELIENRERLQKTVDDAEYGTEEELELARKRLKLFDQAAGRRNAKWDGAAPQW